VLKHEPTTVNRRVILAPAPIGVNRLEFAASAALLHVKVVAFIGKVYGASTPVAPDNGEISTINFGTN
jgi:hypothetical protein